jgi:hypothetical protein
MHIADTGRWNFWFQCCCRNECKLLIYNLSDYKASIEGSVEKTLGKKDAIEICKVLYEGPN